jgi:hypothetical protein
MLNRGCATSLKVRAGELGQALRSFESVKQELRSTREKGEQKEHELEQLLWRLQRSQQALQVSQASQRRQQETKHGHTRVLMVESAVRHIALLMKCNAQQKLQRRYQLWILRTRLHTVHKAYSTPLEAAKQSMSQQSAEKAGGRILALWLSLEKMALMKRLQEWRSYTTGMKCAAENRETASAHQVVLLDTQLRAKQQLQLKSALHVKLLLGKLRVGWVQLALSFRSWCESTRAQRECENRLDVVKQLEIAQVQTEQLKGDLPSLREASRERDQMRAEIPSRHLRLLFRGRWRAWSVAQMWRCLWRWHAMVRSSSVPSDSVGVGGLLPDQVHTSDRAEGDNSPKCSASAATRVQDEWRTRRTSWLQAHVSELVEQVH